MKIWNLHRNSLKNLPHFGWLHFFGWRSGLASLVLGWCLVIALPCMWWVNWFRHMSTPLIQLLRIRCCRRRLWVYKNVSRHTMRVPNAWRPFFAARRYEGRPQQSFWYRMWWEKHWSTGNVGMSTAYWFSILKISWIIAIPVSCQWDPLIVIVSNVEPWNLFNSSISLRLFSWASRRSQFCFNNCSWRSWWPCRRRSSPAWAWLD